MAWIGGNWANARNAVQPGSVAASVTPALVLDAMAGAHAAADRQRRAIAAKVDDVAAELRGGPKP